MSRRRGEFEHRTSIFEGAFRAWSHLGGLEPEDLERQPPAELDPLTNPIEHDPRLASMKKDDTPRNPDGSPRREYPYEPLPRSGLSHPYVQAILSPWLGPDADNEAIQLGLTTLRTWWQHRRKGESGSAIAALGTEKMKGVVEGYTRHFFTLAHCLVVNDKEQPPRTLHGKMKELEKLRSKRNKKRAREEEANKLQTMALGGLDTSIASGIKEDLTDSTLTPLERLHAAQRRQLAEAGGLQAPMPGMTDVTSQPLINIKGKCVPGKIDLPNVLEQVNLHATQLAHRGTSGNAPAPVPSSGMGTAAPAVSQEQYGDPNTTPVVFVSGNGAIQIALSVDGITCAHCVKIVETVLKGCNGNKSPIDGLLDAAADRVLMSVLIRIDRSSNAKRIAFEAARNLAMVGYTAKSKEMSIVDSGADKKSTMDLGALSTAFEVVANTDPKDFFDWTIPCTCPDNGVLRSDCSRHSQMNTRIFESFDVRQQQVTDYMAGCGMRYGMECTCGPGCRCKNCPVHNNGGGERVSSTVETAMSSATAPTEEELRQAAEIQAQIDAIQPHDLDEQPIQVDQPMNFFGMAPPREVGAAAPEPDAMRMSFQAPDQRPSYRAQRNPSIISYGNGLRHMSMTSDATFGRAMSGLSALSIDWENLEDFDLEVDHSAHINNASPPTKMSGDAMPKRSSLRRSGVYHLNGDAEAHVSFKV